YVERLDRLKERYRYVDDVPVMESLPAVGSIGVAGHTGPAADTMRGLAMQLFGLHATNEVVTVALTDSEWTGDLEWIKWLPHTTSETSRFKELPLADSAPAANALLSSLEDYVLRGGKVPDQRGPFSERWTPMHYGKDVNRAAQENNSKVQTAVIVFVTNDAPADRARLTQVLERGADVGPPAVFVSPTVAALPA